MHDVKRNAEKQDFFPTKCAEKIGQPIKYSFTDQPQVESLNLQIYILCNPLWSFFLPDKYDRQKIQTHSSCKDT